MKQKVLAFDIDGVICHTLGSDYKNSKPNKEAIEKINNLYDKGNKIIIFTARFMGRTDNDYKKAYGKLKIKRDELFEQNKNHIKLKKIDKLLSQLRNKIENS